MPSLTDMIHAVDQAAYAHETARRRAVTERAIFKEAMHSPTRTGEPCDPATHARYAEAAVEQFAERWCGLVFEVEIDTCEALDHALVLARGTATLNCDGGQTVRFCVSVVDRTECGTLTAGLWVCRDGRKSEVSSLEAFADALRAQNH